MSMRSSVPFATLLLAAACQSSPTAALGDADRAAIRALDATFVKLVLAGDWPALAVAYYAPDAIVMPPNEGLATGRAGIEASLKGWPPVQSMTLHSDDIVGAGDLAYARGTWEMTVKTPQGPVADKGKCLAIFRRQPDGSWKAVRDIWNSDLPANGGK